MENIIYNELRSRGYNVDVGLVELGGKDENGKFVRKQLEVDFVVNRPPYRVYIQSAFHMPTPEKEQLPQNKHFVEINHKETLAQIFTDIRYTRRDNEALSATFLDALRQQGFLEG